MPTLEEHIRNLCQWPHRGTTTGYEHRAADYARDHLKSLGYDVMEESFTAPDGALYRTFIFTVLCEIAAMAVSLSGSGASIVLALLPFILLFVKFYMMWPIDNYLFPAGKSRNVIGKQPNPEARRKVILSAHLDTQLGGFLFGPRWVGFQGFFTNLTAVCSLLTLALVVIRVVGAGGRWYTTVQVLALMPLLPILYLFLKAEWTGTYVQGASDDASGMGVILSLAEELAVLPPKNLEVWVLATGAEETGLCGMMHFLKRGAGKNLQKGSSCFINHDNLGGGSLRYLTGEVLRSLKYRGDLVKIAERVAAENENAKATPGFWSMPTDALAVTVRGLPAVTLLAYDDNGRTPHYHHPTDTIENLDFSVAESAKRFSLEIIRRLDGAGEETAGP